MVMNVPWKIQLVVRNENKKSRTRRVPYSDPIDISGRLSGTIKPTAVKETGRWIDSQTSRQARQTGGRTDKTTQSIFYSTFITADRQRQRGGKDLDRQRQ